MTRTGSPNLRFTCMSSWTTYRIEPAATAKNAIETADLPAGIDVEDVRLDPGARPEPVARPDLGPGVIGLVVPATAADGRAFQLAAIPYHAWANRAVEAMRVWIPRADLPGSATRSKG